MLERIGQDALEVYRRSEGAEEVNNNTQDTIGGIVLMLMMFVLMWICFAAF